MCPSANLQCVRNNDYDDLQEAFERLPLFSNLTYESADAVAVKGHVKVYEDGSYGLGDEGLRII